MIQVQRAWEILLAAFRQLSQCLRPGKRKKIRVTCLSESALEMAGGSWQWQLNFATTRGSQQKSQTLWKEAHSEGSLPRALRHQARGPESTLSPAHSQSIDVHKTSEETVFQVTSTKPSLLAGASRNNQLTLESKMSSLHLLAVKTFLVGIMHSVQATAAQVQAPHLIVLHKVLLQTSERLEICIGAIHRYSHYSVDHL